jgi:hypothetical protein
MINKISSGGRVHFEVKLRSRCIATHYYVTLTVANSRTAGCIEVSGKQNAFFANRKLSSAGASAGGSLVLEGGLCQLQGMQPMCSVTPVMLVHVVCARAELLSVMEIAKFLLVFYFHRI